MSQEEKPRGAYVKEVFETTQRYAHTLLDENARLRRLVAELESEKSCLERDKLRLHENLLALREEIDRHEGREANLQRQLAKIESESHVFSEQYLAVEQKNADLANLYTASYRLHGTLDRHDLLQVVEEIIINLIGSEELAVFELDPKSSTLKLSTSFGVDAAAIESIPLGRGLIGRVVASGELYVSGRDAGIEMASVDSNITACVPLRVAGRITGAIVLFGLLPQKAGRLEPLDYELLDLLAEQAAKALYCSSLHSAAALDERSVAAS